MSKSTVIWDVYARNKKEYRDEYVRQAISNYIEGNMAKLVDGTVDQIPKITAESRKLIFKHYEISDKDWAEIKKCKEFYNMKLIASILKLGLLISYAETKNNIFLIYLFILQYSAFLAKYYPRGGFDPLVMKLTLDSFDARSDFKKYNNSLIVVVKKKVETFVQHFKREFDKVPRQPLTDTDLRKFLQSSENRMNDSVKVICSRYNKLYKSEEVKVMKMYSKTPDGKVQLSAGNVIEAVRDESLNALNAPSTVVMNMCGLSTSNFSKLDYNVAIQSILRNKTVECRNITNMYIDEYLNRNAKNLTLNNFKNNFTKTMFKARNIDNIKKEIDRTIKDEVKKNKHVRMAELREYLRTYIIGNIQYNSLKVLR